MISDVFGTADWFQINVKHQKEIWPNIEDTPMKLWPREPLVGLGYSYQAKLSRAGVGTWPVDRHRLCSTNRHSSSLLY